MLQSGRAAAAALLTRSVRLVATSTMQQVTAAAAAGDAAARYHSSTAASSSSSSGNMKPGAAFLASLIDYEKVGIPESAGVAGSSSNASTAASSSSSSSKKGFNLQTMHNLLAAMGNPHKELKVVHVAGTKGKGSVVTMLSNMLQNAGYKVGTYTSPHMFDIRERILVGGGTAAAAAAAAPVTEQQWEVLAANAAAAVQNMSAAAAAAARSDAGPGSSSSSSSKPSHFEVVTAMAFQHFANEKVDIAVIETGLGGSTDATNVWNVNNNNTNNVCSSDDQLQVSVITAIGRDHLDALGGSISSIATAKAGIMKSGVPVVVADQRSQCTQQQQQQQQNEESNVSDQQQQQQQSDAGVVWSVLRSEAERLQCPVIEAEQVVQIVSNPDQPEIMIMPCDGSSLARQNLRISASLLPLEEQQQQQSDNPTAAAAAAVLDLPSVSVQLVGAHQKANAQAAVAAALLLRQRGWPALTAAAIQQGLEAAWLPGRFQVIKLPNMSYHLVLDGAHTGESAAALAAAVRAAFPDQPLVLLLAMAADKQHREVCESLRSCRPNVVIFTSVPIAGSHHRSAPPGTLAAHWQAAAILSSSSSRPFRCRELIQANLGAALEKARHELAAFPRGSSSNSEGGSSSSSRGVVLVTGSLHAVAAALKHLELAP